MAASPGSESFVRDVVEDRSSSNHGRTVIVADDGLRAVFHLVALTNHRAASVRFGYSPVSDYTRVSEGTPIGLAVGRLLCGKRPGDTEDIRDDNRGRLRVRLLGIGTPETKKPGFTVGCWEPEATEFAKTTMLGQRVALVTDPTQDRTDRYGRQRVSACQVGCSCAAVLPGGGSAPPLERPVEGAELGEPELDAHLLDAHG